MLFYCGIDLSARDSHLRVIDQHLLRLADLMEYPTHNRMSAGSKCRHLKGAE